MPPSLRRRLSSRAGNAPVAPSAGPRWDTLIGILLLFLPSTSAPTAAPPSQLTKIDSGAKIEYNGGVLDTMPASMWRGRRPCGSGHHWGFRKEAHPTVRGGAISLASLHSLGATRQYLGKGPFVRKHEVSVLADAHRETMWAIDPGSHFLWYEVQGLAAAITSPELGAMPKGTALPPEAVNVGRLNSGFCQSGMILVFGGVVKELAGSLGPPTQAAAGTFVAHAPSRTHRPLTDALGLDAQVTSGTLCRPAYAAPHAPSWLRPWGSATSSSTASTSVCRCPWSAPTAEAAVPARMATTRTTKTTTPMSPAAAAARSFARASSLTL